MSMEHQKLCEIHGSTDEVEVECNCPFGKINDPLREELDEYIAEQEEKAPLSIYQIETALRNLERNRRECNDPLMGGRRETLNQSIIYFKELLNVRREAFAEEAKAKKDEPAPGLIDLSAVRQ